jgi:hypothetical protein
MDRPRGTLPPLYGVWIDLLCRCCPPPDKTLPPTYAFFLANLLDHYCSEVIKGKSSGYITYILNRPFIVTIPFS